MVLMAIAICDRYGHIALNVPNVYTACKRFDELGVAFVSWTMAR